MGIKCLNCNHVVSGTGGLHLTTKCPQCGNDDWSKFIRVDDEDIDPENYQKDKEWLESHKMENSDN